MCLQMGALEAEQKPAVKEALQEALAKTRRIIEHEIRTLLVVSIDDEKRSDLVFDDPARLGEGFLERFLHRGLLLRLQGSHLKAHDLVVVKGAVAVRIIPRFHN